MSLEKSVSQYHQEAMELQLRVDEATHKCEDAERRAEEAKTLWDMETKTRTQLGLKVRWAGQKRLGAGFGGMSVCTAGSKRCLCGAYSHVCMYVRTCRLRTCTYVCMYIFTDYMYVCVYVCTVQLCA